MASELDTASMSPIYLSSTMPASAWLMVLSYRNDSRATKRATRGSETGWMRTKNIVCCPLSGQRAFSRPIPATASAVGHLSHPYLGLVENNTTRSSGPSASGAPLNAAAPGRFQNTYSANALRIPLSCFLPTPISSFSNLFPTQILVHNGPGRYHAASQVPPRADGQSRLQCLCSRDSNR